MLYLIHFTQPLGGGKHQAQHYLGFVEGAETAVQARLEEHRAGWGARITAACNQRGIHYEVVRTMPGDRTEERRLKNHNNLGRYCPICSNQKNKPCH